MLVSLESYFKVSHTQIPLHTNNFCVISVLYQVYTKLYFGFKLNLSKWMMELVLLNYLVIRLDTKFY